MLYKVVTSSRSLGIGNGLTYECDVGEVHEGSAVRVPLRNRLIEGIVIEVLQKRQELYDLKRIKDIIGDVPLLTEPQIRTVRWMSDYYLCTLRQALSVWLPPPPWSNVLSQDVHGYLITHEGRDALHADVPLRGKRQIHILEYLHDREWVPRHTLLHETGAGPATLRSLLEKGLVSEERRREQEISETRTASLIREHPSLTPAQEAAYEIMKRDPRPSLLFGITGSGKTEVYAKLIADTVTEGKQAILLVPEILLTEHSIHRFERLLREDAIAVVHSRLTEAGRRAIWKRIHRGDISLVIGSRSALFSPCRNLGLVVIDEEHEWTYKNEQSPRYHARDAAEELCRQNRAKLVLGSATPSLESWDRAKRELYQLSRLPQRYLQLPLPTVRIVDLADARFGKLYPFTKPLIEAIGERLQRKEQSVLFLNRRGVASAILCLKCRRRIVSPESHLPYTLHHSEAGRPFLMDHTSGIVAEVPPHCPHCQSVDLLPIGAGTQKIEFLLKQLFPDARLMRMDSDTVREPAQMRALLKAMRHREADILLGTQSVVKGLDLPEVTLAAVLLADVGLSLPHFRAGERVFQLLTQLTGRSGRAKPGEVIIQTFRPDAPEVLHAARHETEKYLDSELKLRRHTGYPPAARMIRLIFRGDRTELRAKRVLKDAIELASRTQPDIRISAAPTCFGGGKEWHLLIRGGDPRPIVGALHVTDVIVDVDPMETI